MNICSSNTFLFSITNVMAESVGTIGYVQERYKPAPEYNGSVRTGKEVYDYACKTCHDRTTQGEPLADDIEWEIRSQKGMKKLMQNVKEGYKDVMPEMGGCRNCSDEELLASIMYIFETSGTKPVYLNRKALPE